MRGDGYYHRDDYCDGVTRGRSGMASRCSRLATVDFVKADGVVVGHYCRQHSRGAGIMRMLLPLAWEYERTVPCGYAETRRRVGSGR